MEKFYLLEFCDRYLGSDWQFVEKDKAKKLTWEEITKLMDEQGMPSEDGYVCEEVTPDT